MSWLAWLFKEDRTPEDVVELLESVLDGTLSDVDWDDFISIEIADPRLERVRGRMQEIWTADSPYMVQGSMDPCDLNPKGVTEVKQLIRLASDTRGNSCEKK